MHDNHQIYVRLEKLVEKYKALPWEESTKLQSELAEAIQSLDLHLCRIVRQYGNSRKNKRGQPGPNPYEGIL